MNRISFLKRLLATLFGAAAIPSLKAHPSKASVIPVEVEESISKPRYLLSATVAGKYYYDFPDHGPKLLGQDEDIYTSLSAGFTEHPAQLVLEPNNEFDFRAIEVYCLGYKMGYLPRKDNRIIYNLLKDGAVLETKLRLHVYDQIAPDELYTYVFEQMYDMRVRVYLREEQGA